MKTDKSKLAKVFRDKFNVCKDSLLSKMNWDPDMEALLKQTWLDYVENLGCRTVGTPNGLLPFRSPNFVHIPDPYSSISKIGDSRYHYDLHIQIPKDIALKILSIGLP